MVTVSVDEKGLNGHILLQANLSLNWQQNVRLIISVCIVLLFISLLFSFQIGWLVLPYSGLEIILLSVSLYLFFHHYNYQEVIRFSKDQLIIERGNKHPDTSLVYQRRWSKFYIRKLSRNHNPTVSLISHDKELELGAFLGYEDKQFFIENLKQITNRYQHQL